MKDRTKLCNVVAVAAMTLFIVSLLLTSFQIAIYGDPEYRFYEKEYRKYEVAESLDMEMDDIMDVTDDMMAYLIGEREELSVVTNVDGKRQDFFNDQDRFHMGEVRDLFLGGLKLRNVLLIASAVLILLLAVWKADLVRVLKRGYFRALALIGVLAALLAGFISVDFNRCFTIFHEIFFDNDLWLFDPATDYMIRMLPEGFFFDFVLRIGGVFALSVLLMAAFLIGMSHLLRGRKEGSCAMK